ncbi:uncharacterized protein [Dysidea avara]|uniref:uncharacterized protein isoform X4 n=1 Tax=Dysidea avara TaxID=196820 RepID=UPI0033202A40
MLLDYCSPVLANYITTHYCTYDEDVLIVVLLQVSVAHKCCIQTLFHQLADDYIQARMPILADVNDGGLEKWGKSLNGLTDFKNKRARHFDIHRPGTRIKYCIQVSVAHKCCIQTLFHQLADDYIQARMPILAGQTSAGENCTRIRLVCD